MVDSILIRRNSAFVFLLILLTCSSGKQAEEGAPEPQPKAVTGIAFGSCNKATLDQPLWTPVRANNPDLWIWLGDIVYADDEGMEMLAKKYKLQREKAGYQALRSEAEVIGIYDDHDYGLNDGGKEFDQKQVARDHLFDFLDEPAGSARRSHEGAYASYTYGPEDRMLKVILLDSRYNRETPGPDSDILGETQWAWLEKELRESRARVHVLASSIQFIPEEHRFEKWFNFPTALKRLYKLLADTKVPGLVMISGDRHIAEISVNPDTGMGYPLHELTSSGMTHSYHRFTGEDNRYRHGEVYPLLNFGMITIDWEKEELELQVRDRNNKVVNSKTLALSRLQP